MSFKDSRRSDLFPVTSYSSKKLRSPYTGLAYKVAQPTLAEENPQKPEEGNPQIQSAKAQTEIKWVIG